ncbi:MAG: sensor histidine kinase [Actinomycetota bacterium]|nr:sensor histidine kinase [Actinomycetota bacterium]
MLLAAACVGVLTPIVVLQDPLWGAPLVGRIVLVVLVLAQATAMWWMSPYPERAAAAAIVAGAGIQLLSPVVGTGFALVALSTLAWLRPPRVSLWALGGVVVLSALNWLLTATWFEALLWVAGALLAWSWGELGRARSARRHAETRRAILEERARIGRELHDVLAHTVSVMVVQASAAGDVFDVSPERARAAVRAIESSGRQAQAELRRFLRTVRPDAGSDVEPQPGLADLDRLGRSVSRAGLDVAIQVDDGAGFPLAAGVQLSAYRIVQESLTNTLRHAHAAKVEVSVRVVGDQMIVDIRDDGRGRPGRRPHGDGGGQGILGMRERAELLGGTLHAGAEPDGGFRVSARIPLETSS